MVQKAKTVKLTQSKLQQLIKESIEEALGGNGAEEIAQYKRQWAKLIGQALLKVVDPQNNGSNLAQNPNVRPIFQALLNAYRLCGGNPAQLGI